MRPARTLNDEDIAIGCYTNEPRSVEAARKKLDFEASRNAQLRIDWPFNHCHTVRPRGRGVRGRKIGGPDVTANSRSI